MECDSSSINSLLSQLTASKEIHIFSLPSDVQNAHINQRGFIEFKASQVS